MLMYHVSEEHILKTWSLETLIKKVKHGFNFEMLKSGKLPKEDEPLLNVSEVAELEELYR